MRRKKLIILAPFAILAFALFIAAGGEVVALLWNWLAPSLFGLRTITFWQALGLLALCRLLFGGFGVGPRHNRFSMRRRMRERWEGMTPEERERFRDTIRARCGFQPPAGETKTV